MQLEIAEVRSPQELDRAFRTLVVKRVGAVTVFDDAMFYNERTRITERAAQSQMPRDVRSPWVCGGWRPPVLRRELPRAISTGGNGAVGRTRA
jgi:hypothetical protein